MSTQPQSHSFTQIRRLASVIILGTATIASVRAAEPVAPSPSPVGSTGQGGSN